jgi:hypothetical protein
MPAPALAGSAPLRGERLADEALRGRPREAGLQVILRCGLHDHRVLHGGLPGLVSSISMPQSSW